MRKKSNSNFVADEPKQGWAFFEESGQWRRTPDPWGAPRDHFPKEYGDWFAVTKPKDWTPPAGTLAGESLLDGGAGLLMFAPEGDAGGGSGGGTGSGTKIGAGHKPQGYDAHGRYTGPQGGSISMDGGPVRLFANEAGGEPGAGDDDEAGFEGSAIGVEAAEGEVIISEEVGDTTPTVEQASYEEDGLSGGTEVRGPVTPPTANVTWKNDDPNKPDPKSEELKPQMRESLENIQRKTSGLDAINVNSGKRDGDPSTDPHADGRAVDINKVNGIPVKDLEKAQGSEAVRAREAAKNMEQQAKGDPSVNQVIGPDGGWNKVGRDKIEPIPPKENKELLDRHKDHYHINVYRQ